MSPAPMLVPTLGPLDGTTTRAPTSGHDPLACQERCYPEAGQNYDEDCCSLNDRMSCLGNYTLVRSSDVCASGDGWRAFSYECVPCASPVCDNGPGDESDECDEALWWLWIIILPIFVLAISVICGICCCVHFQSRRHAWEDQFRDRPPGVMRHQPCVEMHHVPVVEAVVQGVVMPGDHHYPTAAAVEAYPMPPLPPSGQYAQRTSM